MIKFEHLATFSPCDPADIQMPSEHKTHQPFDPVTEYYKQFVDRKKLRENLKLTVDQRLQQLREMAAAEERVEKQYKLPPSPDRPWEPVSDCGPQRTTDPIIELYKRDVDRTLLRENLKLTHEQRLLKLSDFMHLAEQVRSAGMAARGTA